MRRGLLLSLLLVCVQPLTVNAGEYYWGLMGGSTSFSDDSSEYEVGTMTGRLGYRHNSYVGAEVRGALSAGADKSTELFGSVEFDVGPVYSAFVKGSVSPTEDGRIELYGLLGYSSAEMEVTGPGVSATASKSGPAFGVGVDLYASNEHGLFFEWLRLQEGTAWGADYTLEHVGLGYIRYF